MNQKEIQRHAEMGETLTWSEKGKTSDDREEIRQTNAA